MVTSEENVRIKMRPRNIPNEKEWDGYLADIDARYAHKLFFGKTCAAMLADFQRNPIERADELRWMPDAAFRYYIFAFVDYLEAIPLEDRSDEEYLISIDFATDGASCFLSLLEDLLLTQPEKVLPVLEDLLPVVKYVANHQRQFAADVDIYGDFLDLEQRVLERYSELGGPSSQNRN